MYFKQLPQKENNFVPPAIFLKWVMLPDVLSPLLDDMLVQSCYETAAW